MRTGQQMIFVGGLHRSGTTPLARALASHPEISGLSDTGAREDEGQHLQDVYPKIRAYGGMGRFANAAAAHLTEHSPLASAASAERLLQCWEPYWDLSKPYLLEKSPSNMIMGRFLEALFPGSSMIVVVRHPVVASLALQKWSPKLVGRKGRRHLGLPATVGHWLRAHSILLEDAAHLERLHILRYEDLVEQPDVELGRIQEFLGLSSKIPAGSIRADRSRRYESQWEQLRQGNVLERRRRRLIEERYGDDIAQFGYDVADLSVRHPGLVAS